MNRCHTSIGKYFFPGRHRRSRPSNAGVTLIESMVGMWLIAVLLLGFIATFMQSRRRTEANVLQAAATSMVYGLIEQIKQADYLTQLPNGEDDPNAAPMDATQPNPTPPYVRVRINQKNIAWLMAVYTPVTDEDSSTATPAPKGPSVCPAITVQAADIGAIDNKLGKIPLSTVTGTRSQDINLNIWLWIDGIPDTTRDVAQMKKVTLVYTYQYQDGSVTRTVRNSEVFLRSRFDQ